MAVTILTRPFVASTVAPTGIWLSCVTRANVLEPGSFTNTSPLTTRAFTALASTGGATACVWYQRSVWLSVSVMFAKMSIRAPDWADGTIVQSDVIPGGVGISNAGPNELTL